jgi:hypothetical protein
MNDTLINLTVNTSGRDFIVHEVLLLYHGLLKFWMCPCLRMESFGFCVTTEMIRTEALRILTNATLFGFECLFGSIATLENPYIKD